MAAKTLLNLTQKQCTKCHQIKPLDLFYDCSRNKSNGKQARCKECNQKFLYAHRKTERGKSVQRKYNLKHYYGLTPEQYEEMFQKQNGVCNICDKPSSIRLAVDHNHETGKIRGLLCRACNTTLGQIEERLDWFEKAEKYLRKHNG